MIAVIFEVEISKDMKNRYFDLASQLRPLLDNIHGFISIERFTSVQNEEKILSLSFWDNNDAIVKWRENHNHINAQIEGKSDIFNNYKISICEVVRQNCHIT